MPSLSKPVPMNAVASFDPELHYLTADGLRLAYWEHGQARKDQPTLLFVHATGFHGRVFDRVAEAFPQCHIIAYEQRGHGRSEHSPIRHWDVMGRELADVVQQLRLRDVVGIGHSMGGHAMIDAAAQTGAFERLVLLDPTVSSPDAYADAPAIDFSEPHPAARRKRHFASPEEMRDRLLPKGAFGRFDARVLMDYCQHGLVPSADGGFELACHPEMEASVYQTARTNGAVLDSVTALSIPVTIMRAMEPADDLQRVDFSFSPTWPGLAAAFANARDIYLPDCTHFIPMQMPDRVIAVIAEAVAEWRARKA